MEAEGINQVVADMLAQETGMEIVPIKNSESYDNASPADIYLSTHIGHPREEEGVSRAPLGFTIYGKEAEDVTQTYDILTQALNLGSDAKRKHPAFDALPLTHRSAPEDAAQRRSSQTAYVYATLTYRLSDGATA